MAFKRKNAKKEATYAPNLQSPVLKNGTAPLHTVQNQIPETIRKGLEQAVATDLDQPKSKSETAVAKPEHSANLEQLSEQRHESEKQVQRLTRELDQATVTLKERLLAEQATLKKVVTCLQEALAQPQNGSDPTTQPDPQLQRRDLAEFQGKLETNRNLLATYFNGNTFVRPLAFNPKVNYYILSPDLKTELDALDDYSMRRLKETFSNNEAVLNTITTGYNADLNGIWAKYQDTGLVAADAKVLNLYQDLQASGVELPADKIQIPDQADWVHNHDGANEAVTDQNGHKVMTIQRRDDKTLWLITYFFADKPLKRDIFDSRGRLSATQMVAKNDGQSVTSETFYRDNGSIVLVKNYDTTGHVQIQLLNEANILTNVFTSEQDLIYWWLQHRVFKSDSCIVLGLEDPLLSALSDLHNHHLEILPLVTDADLDTPTFKALFMGQTAIGNILAGSVKVSETIAKYTNDIRVSTIIPSEDTPKRRKVVLPKLS